MVSIIIFSPFSGRRRLTYRKRRLLLIPTDLPLYFNLENKKCQSPCTIESFISYAFMCTFTVLSNVLGMPADISISFERRFLFPVLWAPGEKSPGSQQAAWLLLILGRCGKNSTFAPHALKLSASCFQKQKRDEKPLEIQCFSSLFQLGYKDSNLEMTESESVALPFGDSPSHQRGLL